MDNVKTFAEVIEETGRVVYTTRGVSMRPLLRHGEDVVVIEKPKEHCKKYDTVLFLRPNGQYVLHRILKVYENRYWIVGDNCVSGEYVGEGQILGVLTEIKHGKRTIKVTDWHYKLYTHIWCDAYPVRFFLLKVKNRIWRRLRAVKRRLLG